MNNADFVVREVNLVIWLRALQIKDKNTHICEQCVSNSSYCVVVEAEHHMALLIDSIGTIRRLCFSDPESPKEKGLEPERAIC